DVAITIGLVITATITLARASTGVTPEIAAEIDTAVAKVLEETGVPGASVAVVQDGTVALTKAYGRARLDPPVTAAASMRYAMGSISKQFVASSVVMLAGEGKLGLDDRLEKFFPGLTRAGDISLRHLLSHTSGMRDFWPQDYVMPNMLDPISADALINQWGRQPLDFQPGSKYQDS